MVIDLGDNKIYISGTVSAFSFKFYSIFSWSWFENLKMYQVQILGRSEGGMHPPGSTFCLLPLTCNFKDIKIENNFPLFWLLGCKKNLCAGGVRHFFQGTTIQHLLEKVVDPTLHTTWVIISDNMISWSNIWML